MGLAYHCSTTKVLLGVDEQVFDDSLRPFAEQVFDDDS